MFTTSRPQSLKICVRTLGRRGRIRREIGDAVVTTLSLKPILRKFNLMNRFE